MPPNDKFWQSGQEVKCGKHTLKQKYFQDGFLIYHVNTFSRLVFQFGTICALQLLLGTSLDYISLQSEIYLRGNNCIQSNQSLPYFSDFAILHCEKQWDIYYCLHSADYQRFSHIGKGTLMQLISMLWHQCDQPVTSLKVAVIAALATVKTHNQALLYP